MGNCLSASDKDVVPTQSSHPQSPVHNGILYHREKDFHEKYIELEVLGQGAMGSVTRIQARPEQSSSKTTTATATTSTNRQRNEQAGGYALKQILLDRVDPENPQMALEGLQNEVAILQEMDHPNILKAHEVYVHKEQIFLVLELCGGGDLYSRMPYTEKQAASIVGKLCSAVKYMHDNGIVHRDLKLQNIMFESKDENAEIKVIDFGLSKKFGDHKLDVMYGGVGSLATMSPQVIEDKYTSQADLWAVGVITFMLLSSLRPFYDKHPHLFIQQIMEARYSFRSKRWDGISSDAKDFISKLLVISEEKRMNADKALKHKWLCKEFKSTDRQPDPTTADLAQESLVKYKDSSLLKRIALNVIAHQSSTQEILDLRRLFDQFDTSNDGVISFQEFQTALKKSNVPKEQVTEIFTSIDVNMNGALNYTEFIAATIEARGHLQEERIHEAFDRLDSDSTGYISRQNLADFLGQNASEQFITNLIQSAGEQKDEPISWKEFLQLFRKDRLSLLNIVKEQSSRSIQVSEALMVSVKNPFARAMMASGEFNEDDDSTF